MDSNEIFDKLLSDERFAKGLIDTLEKKILHSLVLRKLVTICDETDETPFIVIHRDTCSIRIGHQREALKHSDKLRDVKVLIVD